MKKKSKNFFYNDLGVQRIIPKLIIFQLQSAALSRAALNGIAFNKFNGHALMLVGTLVRKKLLGFKSSTDQKSLMR